MAYENIWLEEGEEKIVVVDLFFITRYKKEIDTQEYTLDAYFINGAVDKETVFEEVRKAVEVYGCAGRTNEMKKIFKERFGDDGEMTINGSELLDQMDSYDEWLKSITDNVSPETVNPSWVVTDTYFAFDEI